jgi:SAM-dependent methyltransferase
MQLPINSKTALARDSEAIIFSVITEIKVVEGLEMIVRAEKAASWGDLEVGEKRGLTEICDYYRESADDYLRWSEAGNMHFGLWRAGVSPLDREGMLNAMTEAVASWLALDEEAGLALLDLGCGIGAPARWLSSKYPQHQVRAITLVAEQAKEGERRNRNQGLRNVNCEVRNYLATGLAASSVDRAYALESACYAPGPGKKQLVREAARLLKPGGTLVIADPMLRAGASCDGLFGAALARWCRDFAVPEMGRLDELGMELLDAGFREIEVQEVSWRVLPCLLHAPPLVLLHLIEERLKGPLSKWRKRHLVACFLSFWLGLHLHKMGYFVVKAVKRGGETKARGQENGDG